MTANTALALDEAKIYRLPPREEVPNPIEPLDPLTASAPVTLEETPDALIKVDKRKRARKAKVPSGKGRGRPKTPPVEQPKPEDKPAEQTQAATTRIANAPGGRHPFFAAPVSTTAGWAIFAGMTAMMIGAAIGFWAIR